MCGIWCLFENNILYKYKLSQLKEISYKNKFRGPDNTNFDISNNNLCVFHRLSINDLSESGMQPFEYEYDNKKYKILCNGEIYNYKKLKNNLNDILDINVTYKSNSDCEVLLPYYVHYCNLNLDMFFKTILGEYALVIVETNQITNETRIILGTDEMSVRPLFFQEMKDIVYVNNKISNYMHGLIVSSSLNGMTKNDISSFYYKNNRLEQGTYRTYLQTNDGILLEKIEKYNNFVDESLYINNENYVLYYDIVDKFTTAVENRLMSDRPICCLLSGGWDSLRVCAILTRLMKLHNINEKLHTFTIGMEGGSDLLYARQAAEYLGTIHKEILYTPEEGYNIIPEVIKATGTFDITTIRASIPQYLLMKYISENTNFKVCFNGDGADEVEMGYLYFYLAPNAEQAQLESIKLIENISKFDGLRVDRNISYHGIEARVPFEDVEYVKLYVNINPELKIPKKTRIEKYLSRKAFETIIPDILPKELIWRKKEAFSDGVSNAGKSWYELLQEYAKTCISDEELKNIQKKHENYLMPLTHESGYYRKIFNEIFGEQSEKTIPYYWLPNWTKESDPSARKLSVYNS